MHSNPSEQSSVRTQACFGSAVSVSTTAFSAPVVVCAEAFSWGSSDAGMLGFCTPFSC